MDDYISREAAIEDFEYCTQENSTWTPQRVKTLLMRITSADVEPVVHGRWECVYDDSTGETDITCSHCKNTRTVNGCFVSTDGKSCYFEDDYCPSYGAKMDLEDETNDN